MLNVPELVVSSLLAAVFPPKEVVAVRPVIAVMALSVLS